MSLIAQNLSHSVHIEHATAPKENFQVDVQCFEDFPRQSNMNHLGPKVQSHVSSSSSDEDDSSYDSSEEDRPLVKKSSLRRRDSPPANKHVSFSQSVLRKNEGHLSIERLKPAADPHWYAQFYDYGYDHGYDHEYHYYSHYYQPQGHYYHSAPHRGYYERPQNRNQRCQGHNSHNPSVMLSAWIDRDDHF